MTKNIAWTLGGTAALALGVAMPALAQDFCGA